MLGIFTAALDGARTLAAIDDLAKDLWKEHGAGRIGDTEAENLAGRLEVRRREIRPKDITAVRAPHVARALSSYFPAKRKPPVSPDRARSRDRRRRLAFSGPMPTALAAPYTVGQLAVLRIVADEVRARGLCALPLGAIAAKAGVCMTMARDAIRLAAGDGLVIIQERRRSKAPNLPNVVRIVSREWLTWIRRGPPASKILESTDNKLIKSPLSKVKQSGFKGYARGRGGSEERLHPPRSRSA